MQQEALTPTHFLSLPRPDSTIGPPAGVPDTSTLAAHDFDVDPRTGFMPPQAPLERLPGEWEPWEVLLQDAIQSKLQLGDRTDLDEEDLARSESWRSHVRALPILPVAALARSEVALRRAHHVLAWILHFYVHTLPPDAEIRIPPPVTIPLLLVCTQLQLPPVLTYSDNVLYNWRLKTRSSDVIPALDNIQCQTLFTGTTDEQEFFLCSARIELRGVEVLELMRATMDEIFVGDAIAVRRITLYLRRIAEVVRELKDILLSIRSACDPEVYYNNIRPWLCGSDSDPWERKWVFDGLNAMPDLRAPTELSGPSAGQSSLIHTLTIFLGVDVYTNPSSTSSSADDNKPTFLNRMLSYMPRHHRNFLLHLARNPRPLRDLVVSAADPDLLASYNAAVLALKEFRDAHMIIVTLYIVGPAAKAREAGRKVGTGGYAGGTPKGTGGTDVIKFLKGTFIEVQLSRKFKWLLADNMNNLASHSNWNHDTQREAATYEKTDGWIPPGENNMLHPCLGRVLHQLIPVLEPVYEYAPPLTCMKWDTGQGVTLAFEFRQLPRSAIRCRGLAMLQVMMSSHECPKQSLQKMD